MQRMEGGQRGKEPEWAMGRTGRGELDGGIMHRVHTSWMVSLQVLPRPQLIFPSKNWFFGIYFNFQQQKSLKNQYLPHSESKSYQINSIISYSSRSFQQHQMHIPKIQCTFQWRNHSIFKKFLHRKSKPMKPSGCTPPPRELSRETKNTIWCIFIQWT
jgi:hypothetical protein